MATLPIKVSGFSRWLKNSKLFNHLLCNCAKTFGFLCNCGYQGSVEKGSVGLFQHPDRTGRAAQKLRDLSLFAARVVRDAKTAFAPTATTDIEELLARLGKAPRLELAPAKLH
jgi:hypothetical protein